jgi:hypothetical protein
VEEVYDSVADTPGVLVVHLNEADLECSGSKFSAFSGDRVPARSRSRSGRAPCR